MANVSNNRYLIKPQIFRSNGSDIQIEFFIVDNVTREIVADNVTGLLELKFASGSTAFEIDFDEYFALESGSFLVSFYNLPDYPLSDVLITATIEGRDTITQLVSLKNADVLSEDVLDFNKHTDT